MNTTLKDFAGYEQFYNGTGGEALAAGYRAQKKTKNNGIGFLGVMLLLLMLARY